MNQEICPPDAVNPLHKATLVVLLFQTVYILAQEFQDGAYTSSMTAIFAATVVLLAANRRMFAAPQGQQASAYITWWRYGILILLGTLTVIVSARTYVPDAVPNGTPILIAMLVASVIALKGAALGKLKPNGLIGLRLRWTCQSRLAWEQAHRLMGRFLFYGGLIALAAAPFVPAIVSLAGITGLVLTSVAAGALKARRVWRNDPDKSLPC